MSPDERPSSSRSDVRRGLADSARFHALRWLPLVGAAVVGYLLFPPPAVLVHRLPATGARADRTVVAPFQFETTKSRTRSTRKVSRGRSACGRSIATARRRTIRRSPRRAVVLRRARARRRAGPGPGPGGGGHAGDARPGRSRVSEQGSAATPGAGRRHPLPGRAALAGRGGRRRPPRRAEPPGQSAPGRHRARGRARFHPQLRRPDGASRGRRQRGREPRGTAGHPAAGGGLLPTDRSCPIWCSPRRGASSCARAWIR